VKALMKVGAERGLVLRDVPEPVPGRDEVLIRVLRTGICGTDLHIVEWDAWAQRMVRAPLIVGHEFVGEVVGVGAEVEGIPIGAIVGGEGHLVCGRCRNCAAGRRHLCSSSRLLGVQRDGAFAEFVCLPAGNVWVHRTPIDLNIAAIFDPFGNAVHTALSFPVVGEDVLITGAGPIGMMAALVASHAGADRIVITDVSEPRLQLAQDLGVAVAVNVDHLSLETVRHDLGIDGGFGVGMEMSGSPSALDAMIANMRHGGSIALLGLPYGEHALDVGTVIHRMLTIRGICGRKIFDTWHTMTVLLQSGMDLRPVVTHRLPYSDYELAFDVVRRGECGKVLLDWAGVDAAELSGQRAEPLAV
jgi:threonine 3-dehydrogenase